MNADARTRTRCPAEAKARGVEQSTAGTAIARATGRDRDAWFALLDGWGAAGRPYRKIADWLTGEHAVSNWWAQKLIVEYEQARGVRPPGIRRDGTFEVGASKTVAVPRRAPLRVLHGPGAARALAARRRHAGGRVRAGTLRALRMG